MIRLSSRCVVVDNLPKAFFLQPLCDRPPQKIETKCFRRLAFEKIAPTITQVLDRTGEQFCKLGRNRLLGGALNGHGLAPPAVELPSMHALLMAKGQQLEAAARENGAKSCSFDGKFQSNKFNCTKPCAVRAIGKVPDSDNDRLRDVAGRPMSAMHPITSIAAGIRQHRAMPAPLKAPKLGAIWAVSERPRK